MRFLSNFGCKIIFMCSVNFWHQKDSNSSFKGSIGHLTSKCNWPIEAHRRTPLYGRLFNTGLITLVMTESFPCPLVKPSRFFSKFNPLKVEIC